MYPSKTISKVWRPKMFGDTPWLQQNHELKLYLFLQNKNKNKTKPIPLRKSFT